MSLRRMAARSVRRHLGRYAAYLGSAAFSVMVYFLYTSLANHPHFQSGYRGAAYIVSGLRGASIVIAIFTLLFLLYSGAAFVRSRMKEFGLLSLLGLSRRQLVAMILWENAIIAAMAIGIGLAAGLLFLKLFFMAISLLLRLPEQLPLHAAWPVWRQTLIVFGCTFIFVSVLSLRGVLNKKIIELVRAGRQPKENPSFSKWKVILGVSLVGGGYAWASFPHPLAVALGVWPVTALVSIGTYFVLREVSIAVLQWLHRREKLFYRPYSFLTVSQLTFKLQDNYRVLSAVTILVAVILTVVGTIFTFYIVAESNARSSNPQALQLIVEGEQHVGEEVARVRSILDAHGVDYLTEYVQRLPKARLKDSTLAERVVTLVPYSLYTSLHRPKGKPVPIDDEREAVYVSGPVWSYVPDGTVPVEVHSTKSVLEDIASTHEIEMTVLTDDSGTLFNGVDLSLHAVVLEDSAFEQWVTDHPDAPKVNVAIWTGTRWQGKGMQGVVASLREVYPETDGPDGHLFTSTIEAYQVTVSDFGIALFIGVFVSLVFFAATCSLLYFRLFTEVDEDRRYYARLRQLGLGSGALRRLAMLQAMVLFFVPFIFGLVHATFAMRALGTLLMRTVLQYGWIVALAYMIPYTVYFLVTYNLYWRTLRMRYQ